VSAHVFEDPPDDRSGVFFDATLVRRLWQYIRPHQRLLWAGFALLLFTSACRLALPYILKIAIDDYLTPGRRTGFLALLIVFTAVAACEIIGKAFETWTIDKAGQNALLDLRMAVFTHLQRLSSAFYDRTPIGRLVGRVTTDIEALQELFASGVVTILGDVVFLVATVAILFAMNWRLTLVALLVVPVLFVLTMFFRVKVRWIYNDLIAVRSRLNAFLHEHVVGMPLIQLFRREARAQRDFGAINADFLGGQLRSVRWESSLSALTEMLANFATAAILWYGGMLMLGPSREGFSDLGALGQGMTLGSLFAFIDYMTRFFAPLNDLSLKYTVMQSAMSASDRIFRLMDEDDYLREPEQPVALAEFRGAVSFRDVTFAYGSGEPVLRGVGFDVAPAERVALVGATGSGKSTILKLLMRLYDVQGGAVLLDGVDVRDMALREVRSRVGMVTQDVFLFEGDVLSNIRLGAPHISEEQAVQAAERLKLGRVVQRFPAGYRENVRERGANLSAGERQLVVFARALAAQPELLAFDEATSNVDTQTEELLQQAVKELMSGRTALVVAHRLSTVRDVDRILVMERGEIVEEGRHEDLLARRGVYWRLHELQYQEEGARG
jgi:ATP-binding cassette subfamily B protein